MSPEIASIHKALADFKKTPESVAVELRLSLAEMLMRAMRERGWSAEQLAEKADYTPATIAGILHSNLNCSLLTAGRLLHALGVRARFVEQVPDDPPPE